MDYPKTILLLSGKRKCGKDYIADKLLSRIGDDKSTIIRISEPIKSAYAKEHNLNLNELMSDNPYKEEYRKQMIIWSDEARKNDPGCFCKAACEKALAKCIWIVSDIRRQTDIKWFKKNYGDRIKTVRINASNETRKNRGWIFTTGVDDVASECDLDEHTSWDLQVNNDNEEELNFAIKNILGVIDQI